MKTKQEILQEYLNNAQEGLIKLDIRIEYAQNRHAQDNKSAWLQELAELTANKKETADWAEYLKQQLAKEK